MRFQDSFVRALIASFLLTALCTSVRAQSEQPEEAGAADAAADADLPDDPWERLIYLPFRDLKTVFDNQGASVVIPYVEYLKMWQQTLSGDGADTTKPRVDAVITRADYVATIDGDIARITAELTVRVLGKPWVEVPIKFGEAAVGDVSSETDSVILRGTGKGMYSLLIGEAGDHKVTVQLLVKVNTAPEGRSLQFACPEVGITQFDVTVPVADQDIVISPNAVQQTVDADDGTTRIRANLGATGTIAARWNPHVSSKPQMELLTSVNNLLHVTIAEGLVHSAARLQFDILRGETEHLQISVPKDHRILDVSAAGSQIRGWKADEEDNRQLITVDLLSATSERIAIEVHTERPLTDDAFESTGVTDDGTVFGIHAVGVVRESGQLVVSHGAGLTLDFEQQQGLVRVTADDVDKSLRKPNSTFFRFYSPRHQLRIAARPAEPKITVSHTTQLEFHEDELRLRANLAYQVEKAGIFEIQLQVPSGLIVDNVAADGMSEFKVNADGGVLTIALAEKRQGAIGVTVRGHQARPEGDIADAVVLPILTPLEVERETGLVHIFAPPSIEVIADDSQLIGVTPEHQASGTAVAGMRPVSSWSYTRRPVEIAVRTIRRPTRLTATIGTKVDVQRELVRVESRLAYTVENSGIDTFRFSVPEAVSDSIQIELVAEGAAVRIKQKSAADEAVDGWVAWTVVTQTDVVGLEVLKVSYDLKPDGDIEQGAVSIAVEPPRLLDSDEDDDGVKLSQIVGEVAIHTDRALSVSADATGDDIELIDVRELQTLPKEGYLAYHYFRQPVSLSLTAEKHEIQEIVQTVISKSLVEIVLTRDSMATYLCRYRITSSERQRMRIDLPIGVELHDPLVNGSRVQLAPDDEADAPEGWKPFTVSVARPTSSDQSFTLTLHFRAPVTSGDTHPFATEGPQLQFRLGGVQRLRIPLIGGTDGPVVVQQQLRTVVWVPDDYAIVGAPEGFVRDSRFSVASFLPFRQPPTPNVNDLNQWIGDSGSGLVEFPRDGQAFRFRNLGGAEQMDVSWWEIPSLVWVLSGAVLLIGFFLRWASWEQKLTVVLLAAFGAGLYALTDPDSISYGVAASSYGLIAVAVLWVVQALFGRRSEEPDKAQTPPSNPQDAAVAESASDSPATEASSPPSEPPSPPPVTAAVPPPDVFDMVDDMMRRKKND